MSENAASDSDRLRIWHAALDFIAADATITPAGCPEPWRSTLIEWAQAANYALAEQPVTPEEIEELRAAETPGPTK